MTSTPGSGPRHWHTRGCAITSCPIMTICTADCSLRLQRSTAVPERHAWSRQENRESSWHVIHVQLGDYNAPLFSSSLNSEALQQGTASASCDDVLSHCETAFWAPGQYTIISAVLGQEQLRRILRATFMVNTDEELAKRFGTLFEPFGENNRGRNEHGPAIKGTVVVPAHPKGPSTQGPSDSN